MFTIIGVVVFIFAMWFIVSYLTHIEMNSSEGYPKGYGTFEQFMECFNSMDWKENLDLKSFFRTDRDNKMGYIHASIIRFNGKQMILMPIDYIKFEIWKYNHFKNKEPEVNWAEEIKNIK